MVSRELEQSIERTKAFYESVERKRKCRSDFFNKGIDPPDDSISPIVLQSWRDCRKNGLDPKNIRRTLVSKEDFERRYEKMKSLIHATRPIFDTYMRQSDGMVNTMDLYDPDLVFIHSFGGSRAMNESRYAVPGVCCDPSTAGPTAMSIARQLGTAQRLIGPEHVDEKLQDLICTAVPIYDGSNRIVGIINVVERLNVEALRTLGVLSAIAQGVAFSLQNARQKKELEISGMMNQQILESAANCIIAVGEDGVIHRVNRAALKALGAEFQDDLREKTLIHCFGKNNVISEFLRSKDTSSSRNFSLTFRNHTHHFTGEFCRLAGGDTKSAVLCMFQDMPATRSLLKHVVGWQANMTFANIIGHSDAMQNVISVARKAAELSCNILIQGESGTGKDVFAQAIHNESNYRNGPFVTVNCAAIPYSLIESELFGYESGAFTGARKDGQPGKFELAQDGTLFLDEINSMPLDMQVKLLRVLQEKKVMRIGGRNPVNLNIRIVAASNEDLLEAVKAERFRMDLYYRLNVVMVEVPPLRARTEDIEELCQNFLQGHDMAIHGDAISLLKTYSWPGNVRELENIVARAEIIAKMEGKTYIDSAVIRKCGLQGGGPGGNDAGITERTGALRGSGMNIPSEVEEYAENRIPPAAEKTAESPAHTADAADAAAPQRHASEGGDGILNRKKQELIDALEQNHWNISKTAKQLGMARNTVYNRIRRYGLKV